MKADLVLVTLHVAANMVWVGGLIAAVLVAWAGGGPTADTAKLARLVYKNLAVPAFAASLVFGAARLALDWRYFLVTTHFMHVKLALAFLAIVAHHWIGARLRRLCEATPVQDRMLGWLAVGFGVACFGSVALVVMKPF